MPRPRVTLRRNGITSSGPSGPPNPASSTASYPGPAGRRRRRRRHGDAVISKYLDHAGLVDPASGEERNFLPHMHSRAGRAQMTHQVDGVVQLVGLQREQPLVVAERERGHRVGQHLVVFAAHHAVLDQHAAALGVGQQVPLVGPDERVDRPRSCAAHPARKAGTCPLLNSAGRCSPISRTITVLDQHPHRRSAYAGAGHS